MGRGKTKMIDGYKIFVNDDWRDWSDGSLRAELRTTEMDLRSARMLIHNQEAVIQHEEDVRQIRREMMRRGMDPRESIFG